MARTKVDYIKIGSDVGSDDLFGEFGWVYTKSGDLYYLWWSEAWPEDTTAVHHVRFSLWVSLIREAIENDLEIEFLTEDYYSSKVLTVKLYAP